MELCININYCRTQIIYIFYGSPLVPWKFQHLFIIVSESVITGIYCHSGNIRKTTTGAGRNGRLV